jgi:hypothetical protein
MAGDCFTVAIGIVVGDPYDQAAVPPILPHAKIVHGLPIGHGPENMGKRYWHAWVEAVREGVPSVIDFSNGKQTIMPRDRYYALGTIEQVFRYNRHQALAMIRKHDHCGPWVANWRDMEDPSLWTMTRDAERAEV